NGTGQPISVERTIRRNDNPLDVSVLVSHEQSILQGQYPSCQPVPDQPLPSLTVCWCHAGTHKDADTTYGQDAVRYTPFEIRHHLVQPLLQRQVLWHPSQSLHHEILALRESQRYPPYRCHLLG